MSNSRQHKSQWIWMQILLPLFFVAFMFPEQLLFGHCNHGLWWKFLHEFCRSFASGDLILLGAMILMGIAADVMIRSKEALPDDSHQILYWDTIWPFLCGAIILFVIYTVVKINAVDFELPKPSGPCEVDSPIIGVSVLSIIVTILAYMATNNRYWKMEAFWNEEQAS